MLVARGQDFAAVLPMRASSAAVERALQARAEERAKALAARQRRLQAALATPAPPPGTAAGLAGPMRGEFVRSATESCVATGGSQGGQTPRFGRADPVMRTYCGRVANSMADIVTMGLIVQSEGRGDAISALVAPADAQRFRDQVVRVTASCLARPIGGR